MTQQRNTYSLSQGISLQSEDSFHLVHAEQNKKITPRFIILSCRFVCLLRVGDRLLVRWCNLQYWCVEPTAEVLHSTFALKKIRGRRNRKI